MPRNFIDGFKRTWYGNARIWVSLVSVSGIIAALVFATPSTAALKVGSKAPDFSTQGALAGKPFSFILSRALKKGPIVLYFFPAAFTTGCTTEAHEFAEATPEFQKLGATIIGVTAGSVDRLTQFSSVDCRNKFAVAAATPAMIKEYDVASDMPGMSKLSARTSFVIAPSGKIIYTYTAMSPDDHVKNTLAAVRDYVKLHH
ncbi:MAG: peroxiredoxin [Alphaproteobacteria bacterium]|nr:peroxiredoxin [Alphaproteobacteria bacterium]MDE2042801.1 peroxiredoxin [Alphaproteobacteria bacterium]MDE2340488.1 peroxiredoxin [Alphaproteobacteria bacterium]